MSSPPPDDHKRADDFKREMDSTLGVDKPATSPLPQDIKRRSLVFDAEDEKTDADDDKSHAKDKTDVEKDVEKDVQKDAEGHKADSEKDKVGAAKD